MATKRRRRRRRKKREQKEKNIPIDDGFEEFFSHLSEGVPTDKLADLKEGIHSVWVNTRRRLPGDVPDGMREIISRSAAQVFVACTVLNNPLAVMATIMEREHFIMKSLLKSTGVVACSAGCFACCMSEVVAASPLEIEIIASMLEAHLSQQELSGLAEHIHGRASDIYGKSSDEIIDVHFDIPHPCIFLRENGQCGIYPFRPSSCITYLSASADACYARLEKKETSAVPLLLTGKADAAGAFGILYASLDVSPLFVDLERGLDIRLTTLDATQRWLEGDKKVYASATWDREYKIDYGKIVSLAPPG